ncbi:Cof-type HAD-IIB family hydrolase [Secundilactobacillus folii]|uniref:Cof-type HAD-IIB family hydrolase n=1 Tax=Secundilactobacillus folii TaxID=2678357 RepID=A0A7X3C2Q1_9LACO|nr:Cof-type HAD-IIB family hydrolase [Secundilactobacillus folii]MTV82077.1 Cof-type HAD-IIB family hydrolase [Secundilactobacillus folii]
MIKLVALDLDNTLLTNDKKISKVNENALKAIYAKGVKVVLCTGRPINAIWHYIEQLGLTGPDDYTITFNGALVINNADRSVIAKQGLSKQDITPLYEFCKANGFPLDVLNFDQVYPISDLAESTYTLGGDIKFEPVNFSELPEQMYAKVVAAQEPAILDRLVASLPADLKQRYHIARSQPHILEFLSTTTDKSVGLHALLNHFEWDESNLMAFGDAENDAGMLKAAKIGVAMANAQPEITAMTSYHTGTNEEDGVAQFVSDYFK